MTSSAKVDDKYDAFCFTWEHLTSQIEFSKPSQNPQNELNQRYQAMITHQFYAYYIYILAINFTFDIYYEFKHF